MTQREFEQRLPQIMEGAKVLLESVTPVRSRKLLLSIVLRKTDNGYVLEIGGAKAPHMPYTEEKWIHEQWRGRENPNEGWFKEATELVFQYIRAQLSASGRYVGNKDNGGNE